MSRYFEISYPCNTEVVSTREKLCKLKKKKKKKNKLAYLEIQLTLTRHTIGDLLSFNESTISIVAFSGE